MYYFPYCSTFLSRLLLSHSFKILHAPCFCYNMSLFTLQKCYCTTGLLRWHTKTAISVKHWQLTNMLFLVHAAMHLNYIYLATSCRIALKRFVTFNYKWNKSKPEKDLSQCHIATLSSFSWNSFKTNRCMMTSTILYVVTNIPHTSCYIMPQTRYNIIEAKLIIIKINKIILDLIIIKYYYYYYYYNYLKKN